MGLHKPNPGNVIGAATAHLEETAIGLDKGYNNNTDYQGTGGSLARFDTPGGHPIDTSQPAFPVFHRKFANPAPLGLLAFAATTFVLSMYNVQARHITHSNVILGMALGYGGLVELIAGVEEWASGNTFAATAFTSYGGLWLSFGTLYIPQFDVTAAYTSESELNAAIGIYLCAWGIITSIFFISSLKSSIALAMAFFFADLMLWMLVAGYLAPSTKCIKAGGALGIFTSLIAAYTALASLLTNDTSYFQIPVGDLSRQN